MDRSLFNLVLMGTVDYRRFYNSDHYHEIIAEALKHPDFVMFNRGDCLTRILRKACNGHKYSDIVKWCTDALTVYGLTSYTIKLWYVGASKTKQFITDLTAAGFDVVTNDNKSVTITHRDKNKIVLHPELELLASTISEWPEGATHLRSNSTTMFNHCANWPVKSDHVKTFDGNHWFSYKAWREARRVLNKDKQ